ncbi:MAG: dynamin family protein [Phaeodactylibacter sp.]|nr:dynamin family protein [Phaeodactylibacter sp.]
MILDQQLLTFRTQIDEVVKDLHELTLKIRAEELAHTVSDLRNRINEPFMFVIVGEVKAGKSSFVNALLDTGREITKVAPQPMTDTIQQILYGEQEEILTVNPFLKKIFLPVEILKEIAIVDTPGTNTIIEQHQEITERFIPASDLIVFVFEAKNPYRQSAGDFFDFIHADWRKKFVFVLQQKDLMSEEDLQVNIKGVKDYAEKKGITGPHIFAVSAKLEQDGDKAASGFEPLRGYILDHITGGKAPFLKLQNNLHLSENINDRLVKGLETRRAQWEADKQFRADIRQTLQRQSEQSQRQVGILVENLIAGYDRVTAEKEKELASGLGIFSLIRRSLTGIFRKSASAKEWLDGLATSLEADLEQELQTKLNQGIGDLAESIQQMAKLIDLQIKNSRTILKENHAIFSDIAERRGQVMSDLQTAFQLFLKRSENYTGTDLFPNKQPLSPSLFAGSGIAIIGAILTAVTNLTIVDVTGGILTAVGLLFAGVSTSARRRRIIQSFHEELQNGRERLHTEVTEKLNTYIHQIRENIDNNFKDFDLMLVQEEQEIQQQEVAEADIRTRLSNLRKTLEALPILQ